MPVSHVDSELTVFKSGDELVSETWPVRFSHGLIFLQKTENEDNSSLIFFYASEMCRPRAISIDLLGTPMLKSGKKKNPPSSILDRGPEK